jgi:hypothetical protein
MIKVMLVVIPIAIGAIVVVWKQWRLLREMSDYIKEADSHIHDLTQHDSYRQLVEAERKEECALANCKRLLKVNETLRTLNRGLCITVGELKEVNERIKKTNQKLREENAEYREERAKREAENC